jgi:hypothetical protein
VRFCSTPESASNGEITFLAILETMVAIALSLLLVKLLDRSVHIVVGALIAPLLLLRTEASTAKGFSMFDSSFPRLMRLLSFFQRLYGRLPAFLRLLTFFLVWLPLFSLLVTAIKCIATIRSLISSPRDTLFAISGNWLRIAFSIDLRHPPEFLPGVEMAPEDAPANVRNLRYEEVRRQITSGTGSALAQKLSLLAIYGPTVLYRLFLKSTSLIYFPLIWVSRVPMTPKGILSFPIERVRRWYSGALILLMLSPLAISYRAQETMVTARDRAVFSYILPVHRTDWWHISRVAAVALTVALYFYARKLAPNELEHERQARWIIMQANRLRAACGIITMACFLLIILIL